MLGNIHLLYPMDGIGGFQVLSIPRAVAIFSVIFKTVSLASQYRLDANAVM